jgi:hypothetical protein
MKSYRKLQEALCRKRAKCRTLGLTIGLAILAIVASPAQGQTVSWGPSVQLDDGFAPRVATSGTTVVQVHQATNGSGPLVSHGAVGAQRHNSMVRNWQH